MGVPCAAHRRSLLRDERDETEGTVPLGGVADQLSRRNGATAGAQCDGSVDLPGDGPSRAGDRAVPRGPASDRVPGAARGVLYLGTELRQHGLQGAVAGAVPLPSKPAGGGAGPVEVSRQQTGG